MRKWLWFMGFIATVLAACGESTAGADPATGASSDAGAVEEAAFTWADIAAVRAVGAPAVRAYLADLDDMCADARFGENGVAQTDFNADGRPDFLLYMSSLYCGGEPVGNMNCGSGGCGHDLLVSSGSDYVLRSFQSIEVEIVRRDGRPAVRVPLEGDQVQLLGWNGSEMAEIETEQSRARAADEAEIRRVIATIYDRFTYDPERGGAPPPIVDFEALQTPALNRAIAEGSDPDVGLGYDPYCGCQDYWDVRYTLDDVVLEGDEATVLVLFNNAGGRTQRYFIVMRRTSAGWRVDDITGSDGSLRASLDG